MERARFSARYAKESGRTPEIRPTAAAIAAQLAMCGVVCAPVAVRLRTTMITKLEGRRRMEMEQIRGSIGDNSCIKA